MRVRLGPLVAVVVLVVACAAPRQVSPGPTGGGSPSVLPSISGATNPPLSPGGPTPASTQASAPVSTLTWHQIGTLAGSSSDYGQIVGFAGGYIVHGGSSTGDVVPGTRGDGLWYSPDGLTWTAVDLPFPDTTHSFSISTIAAQGHEVVIVGGYEHEPCTPPGPDTGGGPECPSSPISWHSTDGTTWESSYPWTGPDVPTEDTQGSDFSMVWAVPTGGWDAATSIIANESTVAGVILHSPDGLTWTALPSAPPTQIKESQVPTEGWTIGAADASGRRVVGATWYIAGGEDDSSLVVLFTSADGRSWKRLDTFPGSVPGVDVIAAIPPAAGPRPVWLIAGGPLSRNLVWTSPDLAAWSEHAIPAASPDVQEWMDAVAVTHLGYVALGTTSAGTDGASSQRTSWVSADGIAWVRLPTPGTPGTDGPDSLADGPAGLIGIGFPADGGAPPVIWALR